ncbi:hypothetical protein LCGC14_1507560 [marine sediment metagenome]|uniref:Uncharacterized protein n=1 Tax=marine sediment metagenome TaxID=412755 RepID=A0A0F9J2E7_9ZZZZ
MVYTIHMKIKANNKLNEATKMIKIERTRNTKWLYDNYKDVNNYTIEGVVRETGRYNNIHAKFRFNFVRGSDFPTFVIRTRNNFNKRFSSGNTRIHRFCEFHADINNSSKVIEIVMEAVYSSHEQQIEREFLAERN